MFTNVFLLKDHDANVIPILYTYNSVTESHPKPEVSYIKVELTITDTKKPAVWNINKGIKHI
jgi:hypothetical protein